MSAVNIKINGRPYTIGCDAGEEDRVIELGNYIDEKVQKLALSGGTATDSHLLVLAGIIMADELFELKDLFSNTQQQYQAVSQKLEEVTKELHELREVPPADQDSEQDNEEIARTISSLADRIEAIAEKYKA